MTSWKTWLSIVSLSAITVVVTACSKSVLRLTAPMATEHGINLAGLDRTCAPCQDFNQFANGNWVLKNPIPAAYPSWGVSNEVMERNRNILHSILEDAAKNTSAAHGSVDQKIGDYYGSCMDTTKIDSEGITPLKPELDSIAQISNVNDLEKVIVRFHQMGIDVFFGTDSTQDFADSTQVTGEVDQGGLGLPDRDYYTRDDPKSKNERVEYQKHVTNMFTLMGDSPAKAATEAQTVMDLETELAKASQNQVFRRDPKNVYHRMSQAQVRTLAPNFPWQDYFTAVGLAGKGDVNVVAPDFFKTMGQMISARPMADWQVYLRWHLINAAARSLSTPFVDEDFHFKGMVLTGTKEILPRWKRCVSATDRAMGEAVGQVYVKKAFPPEAKARALEMVKNLEAALADDITTLSWMSDPTRKQALIKLHAIANKIGYPDKWRDYSSLDVKCDPYVDNVFASARFEFHRDMNKVGKPVDRTEWGMSPPTVNAYYNPQLNEIVFPAGILQPPFFDFQADDAVNYGSMGAIIGHEMTHGFDDQGSQFDAQGNMKNWWTPADQKNFTDRGSCVANQFDGFVVDGKLHENGKLVEGESIADLGGLAIAYAAYHRSLQGKPAPRDIDGFTPDQRFFLAYAQSWAESMRPQYERMLTNVDPHPLPKYRVLGALSNMPEFARAFNCKAGDAMVRPAGDRCGIW